MNYILQFNYSIVGWSDEKAFETLEEALGYIRDKGWKNSNCRIIKLVATFEEKYETRIHGEGDN